MQFLLKCSAWFVVLFYFLKIVHVLEAYKMMVCVYSETLSKGIALNSLYPQSIKLSIPVKKTIIVYYNWGWFKEFPNVYVKEPGFHFYMLFSTSLGFWKLCDWFTWAHPVFCILLKPRGINTRGPKHFIICCLVIVQNKLPICKWLFFFLKLVWRCQANYKPKNHISNRHREILCT